MIKKISIVLILLVSLCTGWIVYQRSNTHHQSDVISTAAPEFGPKAHKLLPNLSKAHMVVPDRPHDPAEIFSEHKHQQIQRTREFTVSTNSLGFRNREISDKHGLRIVCVGDSVTFGWGVEAEDSYPAQLELLLQKNYPTIEVINTGVPALKPEHIQGYIQSFVRTVQPDLLIIAMRPNWMTPNPLQLYVQTIQKIQEQYTIPIAVLFPPLASFDPKGRSNNAKEVQEVSRQLKVPFLDLTPIFDNHIRTNNLGGVELVLDKQTQQMRDRTSKEILAQGQSPHGLAPEITAVFESNLDIREPLFFDGGHPDKEGFVVFADAVANWLHTNHIIPQ